VTAVQVRAAEQAGIANAWDFARACARTGLPFYLGLAILDKESRGRNVYGHDVGGAMSGAGEVTEANYREFRRLVDAGHKSNGVGPMQITYRGYFPMADNEGLRLWVPAENMLFGCRILARALTVQLAKGKPLADAFWETARAWNAGATGGQAYAHDALSKARTWLAVVGNADAPNFTL
jgi:hypothetical protein